MSKDRIEQLETALYSWAERAEKWRQESVRLNDELTEMSFKNKRYREALEFYADEKNYNPFDGIFLPRYQNKVDEDGGEVARKALEGEE